VVVDEASILSKYMGLVTGPLERLGRSVESVHTMLIPIELPLIGYRDVIVLPRFLIFACNIVGRDKICYL